MEVREAIHQRKSCRSFLDKPVPVNIIEEVLDDTVCAPSAINMQPWQFTVAAGEERRRLSRSLMKAYREKAIQCGSGTATPLPDEVYRRRNQTNERLAPLFEEMGVSASEFVNEGSLNFYNAPMAVIVSFDRVFTEKRLLDMGLAVGYFLLSAHDHGLATCPIGLISAYEDTIRETLNIREEHSIPLAVATGYADPQSPINRLKTPRDGLKSFVRWFV